jgi:hypothetical protein
LLKKIVILSPSLLANVNGRMIGQFNLFSLW